jgi:hypothetical protein
MRRLALLTLVMVIFVAGACGNRGGASAKIVLKSKQPIVALALRGSDIAWLEEAPFTSRTPFSLWLRTSGKTERLLLPYSPDDFGVNFNDAEIALTRGEIGWYMDTYWEEGHGEAIAVGASSVQPRKTALLASEYGDQDSGSPGVGEILTGVAAAGGSVFWGTANIAYDVTPPPDEDYCDENPMLATSCRTWISGGSVNMWTGGKGTRVHDLPPAAAFAGSGQRVAIATWPRGPRGHGDYPPLGEVIVLGPSRQIVARVELPKAARLDSIDVELALSQRLLALSCSGGVWIWELPSGRLVRRLNLGSIPIALTRNRLVIWGPGFVATVDPASGRRTQIATAPGPTAVAADGDRLAWALTDSHGHSVVKMMRVD